MSFSSASLFRRAVISSSSLSSLSSLSSRTLSNTSHFSLLCSSPFSSSSVSSASPSSSPSSSSSWNLPPPPSFSSYTPPVWPAGYDSELNSNSSPHPDYHHRPVDHPTDIHAQVVDVCDENGQPGVEHMVPWGRKPTLYEAFIDSSSFIKDVKIKVDLKENSIRVIGNEDIADPDKYHWKYSGGSPQAKGALQMLHLMGAACGFIFLLREFKLQGEKAQKEKEITLALERQTKGNNSANEYGIDDNSMQIIEDVINRKPL